MRSPSPLLSYQQILDTRQCALSEQEVIVLITQLLTEISKLHAAGQIHGNLSLDHLWRDVEGELYMHPAEQVRPGWTPRDDVRSIARIALALLTNQPVQSDWQSHPNIRKPLSQLLAAALNFTAECPIRDASDLLQALYRINCPHIIPIPQVLAPQPKLDSWLTLLGRTLCVVGTLSLKLLLGAGLVGSAGWLAYEHFSEFLPDPPKTVTETQSQTQSKSVSTPAPDVLKPTPNSLKPINIPKP